MLDYLSLDKAQLRQKQRLLQKSYDDFKAKGLKLDMSRGKPGADQTDLSGGMFDILNKDSDFRCKSGVDCRNYGLLEGIPEMREMFAQMLGVSAENVFVGGNSSQMCIRDRSRSVETPEREGSLYACFIFNC